MNLLLGSSGLVSSALSADESCSGSGVGARAGVDGPAATVSCSGSGVGAHPRATEGLEERRVHPSAAADEEDTQEEERSLRSCAATEAEI